MWIIPKTLSAFVPDTEGLNLESSELAWMCEQSLMWRSKHSAAPTWQRRLKKGGWITHLSGRILKPSLHESFVEKYTDSLEDIHANHSVQQGSEKEKKTQDTYGHTSSSTSGQLDLFGAFGKMSQDTPRWGYGESCPIWKKKVTDARGAYSARKKLALHTKGNECSSWPTASARDHKGGYTGGRIRNGKVSMDTLDVAVQAHTKGGILDTWATPQASDHIEGARTAKESNQKCLGRDLNQQNWPTPRAGNPGSRKPGTGGKILAEEAKKHNGLQDQEKSNTSGKNHGSWPTPKELDSRKQRPLTNGKNQSLTTGTVYGTFLNQKVDETGKSTAKLNPNWTESLMLGRGMTGWTQLPTEWIVSDS